MSIKRAPEISQEFLGRFHAISKAEWAELYRDLFRQVFGEDKPEQDWMADAEKRREILRRYRQA